MEPDKQVFVPGFLRDFQPRSLSEEFLPLKQEGPVSNPGEATM